MTQNHARIKIKLNLAHRRRKISSLPQIEFILLLTSVELEYIGISQEKLHCEFEGENFYWKFLPVFDAERE
jgi:uncharacterized protein (DUF427 family)